MVDIGDRFGGIVDSGLAFFADKEKQAHTLKALDKNSDGTLTAKELMTTFDHDKDGYLNAEELETLATKAESAGFDKSTIKAMAHAANHKHSITLFKETDGVWEASEALENSKDTFSTIVPYAKGVFDSLDLNELKGAKEGLFKIQDQHGNSCGTTSLSMMMKYYQGHTLENSVPTIDKYIRAKGGLMGFEIDGFTAPRDIVDYARDNGFRAGMKTNASTSEIKDFLKKGIPVTVLTDWSFKKGFSQPSQPNPSGDALHWVDVIGYEYIAPEGKEDTELHFVIANPNGYLQKVSESDFEKVWSNLALDVNGTALASGLNRLMIAMVPTDEDYIITAPDGSTHKAGDIDLPYGDDGISGWVAQTASGVMQDAANLKDETVASAKQFTNETLRGYAEGGVGQAWDNFWNGDSKAMENMKNHALESSVSERAKILNKVLDYPNVLSAHQDMIYEVLRETSWGDDFNTLISLIDANQLAKRITSDSKAGKIMAWIAHSEVQTSGKTGPKFEAFATELSYEHREDAVLNFLDNQYTKKGKLLQKAPASLVRTMIKNLRSGHTSGNEEKAIYKLLQATSWSQFEDVMSRLNMSSIADELESDSQLGNLTAWVIKSSTTSGNWGNLSEILSELENWENYQRADNVLGNALTHSDTKNLLHKIPSSYRTRMIDLLDDMTRYRTDDAVTALKALKKYE